MGIVYAYFNNPTWWLDGILLGLAIIVVLGPVWLAYRLWLALWGAIRILRLRLVREMDQDLWLKIVHDHYKREYERDMTRKLPKGHQREP